MQQILGTVTFTISHHFTYSAILSSPKIDGVVTPPEDHPLMKPVKEPATPLKSPKIKTTDELENSLKIASTFGMEKCQVCSVFVGDSFLKIMKLSV